MTIRLNFIRETPKARLYSTSQGDEFWIPRSVIHKTLKFPPRSTDLLDMAMEVHELEIEDWWWEKHVDVESPEDDPERPFSEYGPVKGEDYDD